MRSGFYQTHFNDVDGNPAGGLSVGRGFTVNWQNGPLMLGLERVTPNGAFVEDVIDAAIGRIEYYQSSKFNCGHNERALLHLKAALAELDARTADREARSVEGTHSV